MKLLILLLLPFFIIPAYGLYEDIPPNEEVHFTFKGTEIVALDDEFNITLKAVDDRTAYYKYLTKTPPLKGANVTISIQNEIGTDILTGKTDILGRISLSQYLDLPYYSMHDKYEAVIEVQYGNSTDTQSFEFWTVSRGDRINSWR